MPNAARGSVDDVIHDDAGFNNPDAGMWYVGGPPAAVTLDFSKMDPTSDSGYQAFLRRQGVSSGRANQAIAERLDRLNRERTRFLEDQQLGTTRNQYRNQLRADRAFEDAERARQDIAAGREAGQFRMDDIARMRDVSMQNLTREQQVGTRNTNTDAAARGLFQSSQRMADLSDLEQEIVRMRANANQGFDANVRDVEASLRGLDLEAGDIERGLARAQRDSATGIQDYAFDTERERIRYEQDYERTLADIERQKAEAAAAAAAARNAEFVRAQLRTAEAWSNAVADSVIPRPGNIDGVAQSDWDTYYAKAFAGNRRLRK